MRHLLILAALLLGMMSANPATAARPVPKAKLLAVYFYADWCTNCKALAPALNEARAQLNSADVLFVTLDLTDKPRIHQSLMLAQALGIGEFLRAQGSATGYVAVLDAASKKELARVDRTSDSAAIIKTIQAQLN